MRKFIAIGILAATIPLFDMCAVNPVTGKKQIVLMSEEQEIELGKQSDPEIIQQFGLYEDKALQEFINQKGKEMAAVSHRPELQYQFRIVDSDILNAFAVPGGYVYFTRGIMAHFNNEAEFAGVLGHEIGHITARHSVIQQRNAMLGQIGLIAGMVIAPELSDFAQTASQGMQLLFLKFGRDDERQSDDLGVEYSSKIGYDAQQMAGFFNTLKRKSAQTSSEELPAFLSTHPDPGDRNVAVSKLASEWKQQLNLAVPKVNRDAYLRRIDGIIYGEDPKQGFVENNVFYHPVLKIQFTIPSGWASQNSPQTFQMASKDGKAMMLLNMAPGKTLKEAADAILKQYNLTLTGSSELTVNGLPAMRIQANQALEQGTLSTLSYLIQHGGNIYHLIGVAAQADYNSYASLFASSMQSFRNLTDASKLSRKPERVRIKTVKQTGTLEQALKSYNAPVKRYEELAILNGMTLKEKVQQGSLFKVIEQ